MIEDTTLIGYNILKGGYTMKNKIDSILIGLILVAVGVIYGGNALNVWDVSIFFAGWWTLFIIVPCAIDMIKRGINYGSTVGLTVGILLMLTFSGILDKDLVVKLIVPIFLIAVGISVLLGASNLKKKVKTIDFNGNQRDYYAIFNGQKITPVNETFGGANITTVFGSVDLDLRSCDINSDIVINTTTIFGGAKVIIPNNVNVKVSSVPILGGVSNKSIRKKIENAPTIYFESVCIFGGIEIV